MTKLTNIPPLRFPEFKGEWGKKKLGEVGDVKMCRRIFNEETLPIGEIPFYKIGSFGKIADAFITKELYNEYKNKFSFPKKGEILISAAGTIGRLVVYNGEDAYYQDSNIVWIENDNSFISNEFLYIILQNVTFKTEGGTIQRLYNNILKSTEFKHPTLPEQTKIATFLTAVDEKIQALKKKKSGLENYKKGLMQRLFCLHHDSENSLHHDSLDLHDEHDFEEGNQEKIQEKIQEKNQGNQENHKKSRFRQLRFKDENGKEFPAWEVKKLGEVCESLSSGKDKPNENNNYPIYGSMGVIGYNSNFTYNKKSILIARVGANAGTINLVDGEYGVTDNTLVLINSNNIEIQFLYYLLVFQNLNKLVFGSGQPLITAGQLKSISLNIPSLPEQTKIANFLSAIDEKINHTQTQITQTETWKKGLLQKMFV